ncbi:hypothetical protein RP20_CCG005227 [Aedes albopictus]|nr:hypothetical protein RP20_CCG005227 [Aedes albopictus]
MPRRWRRPVSVSSSMLLTTEESAGLQPYFDFDVQRNLTFTVGQTGFLHCRVERLGDKDVAWIRKRDLHILTTGSSTYTSDQRFQIKYPQVRDSGVYECQINTEPKMSLSYELHVIALKKVPYLDRNVGDDLKSVNANYFRLQTENPRNQVVVEVLVNQLILLFCSPGGAQIAISVNEAIYHSELLVGWSEK